MNDFDIRVVGARPRKNNVWLFCALRQGARSVLMHPHVLVLIVTAAFVVLVGTPHIGWDYVCRYRNRPGEPCHNPVYCAYYGIQGRRVTFPEPDESCKLITILPLDWQAIGRS